MTRDCPPIVLFFPSEKKKRKKKRKKTETADTSHEYVITPSSALLILHLERQFPMTVKRARKVCVGFVTSGKKLLLASRSVNYFPPPFNLNAYFDANNCICGVLA